MAWEREGRFYTRSYREAGRVRREYIGGGSLGEEAAAADRQAREERQAARTALRDLHLELYDAEALILPLVHLVEVAVVGVLVEAGYHRHKRGEWRKRRAQLA